MSNIYKLTAYHSFVYQSFVEADSEADARLFFSKSRDHHWGEIGWAGGREDGDCTLDPQAQPDYRINHQGVITPA